jgi:hypothetical protein
MATVMPVPAVALGRPYALCRSQGAKPALGFVHVGAGRVVDVTGTVVVVVDVLVVEVDVVVVDVVLDVVVVVRGGLPLAGFATFWAWQRAKPCGTGPHTGMCSCAGTGRSSIGGFASADPIEVISSANAASKKAPSTSAAFRRRVRIRTGRV